MSTKKRAYHWIFGRNVHLSFEVGLGYRTTLPYQLINQREGCDTVSDPLTGELLFHTNGIDVWDSNFNDVGPADLLSGSNTPLLEPDLSMQAITIVKKPDSTNIYYFFFVGNWGTSASDVRDIRYRTVDVSTWTWGSITTLSSAGGGVGFAENLTAILKPNNVDYWIITKMKGNNVFRIWSLTSSGVTFHADRTIGFVLTGSNRFGQIKISPDRKRLLFAIGGTAISVGTDPTVAVWDFNNVDASLSNERILLTGTNGVTEDGPTTIIGGDFSPDSSIIYTSSWASYTIHKIVLWNNITYSIYSTAITGVAGAVQLGPDDAVYFACYNQSYIRRITPTYSNVKNDSIIMNTMFIDNNNTPNGLSRSFYGLPVFPAIAKVPNDYRVYHGGTWYSVCDGDVIQLYDEGTSSWKQISPGDKYYDQSKASFVEINCSIPQTPTYLGWNIEGFYDPALNGYPAWSGSAFTLAKTDLLAPISVGTVFLFSTIYGPNQTVVQVQDNGAYKDVIFQHTFNGTESGAKFLTPA